MKLPKKEGNAMIKPSIGESFNRCKQWLWDLIHSSQKNIDQLIAIKKTAKIPQIKSLCELLIAEERKSIKDNYEDLKALQRWFNSLNIDPDAPITKEMKYGKK